MRENTGYQSLEDSPQHAEILLNELKRDAFEHSGGMEATSQEVSQSGYRIHFSARFLLRDVFFRNMLACYLRPAALGLDPESPLAEPLTETENVTLACSHFSDSGVSSLLSSKTGGAGHASAYTSHFAHPSVSYAERFPATEKTVYHSYSRDSDTSSVTSSNAAGLGQAFIYASHSDPPSAARTAYSPSTENTVLFHRYSCDSDTSMTSLFVPASTAKLERAFLYAQLKTQFQTITSTLWPWVLTGITTMHDVIHYHLYPEDRYGYGFRDTFFGLAPIEASWNYHFGADLVRDPRYPLAFLLLLPFPMLLGVTLLRKYAPPPDLLGLSAASHAGEWSHYLPWNACTYAIEKSTFTLLWGDELSEKSEDKLLKTFRRIAQQDMGLSSYQAIRALGEIADEMPANASCSLTKEALQTNALKHLTDLIEGDASRLKKGFASYELWTLNRLPKKCRSESAFWLWTGLSYASVLLANYHAFRLIVLKLKGLHDYYRDKGDCEAAGKIFSCLDQIAACTCGLCLDFAEGPTADPTPSIHYSESDNPQACLRAALSEKRSPAALLEMLPRFLGRSSAIIFDGSLQHLATWTDAEWDALLHLLETHQPALNTFNLSHPDNTPTFFTQAQLLRLRSFLGKMQIAELDLSGQQLTALEFAQLMDGISNAPWTALDVSRNRFGDAGLSTLAALLAQTPALTSLTLSGSGMTDAGARVLYAALEQGLPLRDRLTYLDLSDNAAGGAGLAQLLTAFYNRSLSTLILSRLPLTPPVFEALSPLFAQLRQLSLVDAGVSDAALAALLPYNETRDCNDTQMQTAYYDFSHNPLGEMGLQRLLAALPDRQDCPRENSTQPPFANPAMVFSFAYTQLHDAALSQLAFFLRSKYIVGLKLDGTPLTVAGLTEVLPDFCHPDAFVSYLSLREMYLSDPIASQLASLLRTSTCGTRLTTLDMANNEITGAGAAALFAASPNTQLERLSLAYNPLTGAALHWENQTQDILPFSTLDLSKTNLNPEDTDAVCSLLQQAPDLAEYALSDNPLGPGLAQRFAEILFTPIPPHLHQLTNQHAPRDTRRLLGLQAPLEKMYLEPSTQLQVLRVSNTGANTGSARTLCRIFPHAGLFASDFGLENNRGIDPRFVNPTTCAISAAPTHTISPSVIALLSVFWLLPCLFRSTPAKKPTCAQEEIEANPSPLARTGFFAASARRSTDSRATPATYPQNYGIVSSFGSVSLLLIFALLAAHAQSNSYEKTYFCP